MNYSNARNGVKKIFVSELIALAASVILLVFSVIGWAGSQDSQLSETLVASDIMLLVGLGIYIFAYILQIIGIVKAGKDEPAFKVSLYAILALLAATILEGVFYKNQVVAFIFEIAQGVAEFFLVHYIIHGIMHISEHLEKPEMIKKGKRIFIVIYTALAFEIIVIIFEIIFGKEAGEELSAPFEIVANVLKMLENILFLIYIGKGNNLLKKTNDAQ